MPPPIKNKIKNTAVSLDPFRCRAQRRIYDITNVLEGINLIEKQSKNIIVWKGSGLQVNSELQDELEAIRTLKQQLEGEEVHELPYSKARHVPAPQN